MESKKVSENFSDLKENIKEYIQLRIDILTLTFTEKFARVASLMVITMIFLILFFMVLLFLSLAFMFWFRDHAGPGYVGALIVAGFYTLLGGLVFLMRNSLFINPIISQISKIFLEESDDHEK